MRQRNHSLVHKDSSPSSYSANPAGIGKRKEAEISSNNGEILSRGRQRQEKYQRD